MRAASQVFAWFLLRIGAHCTGLEPVYRFRDLVQLNRKNAVVGAVGASFSLNDGINPLALAH